MTLHEAVDITLPMTEAASEHKIAQLDDKFWVWETLEEAIRPDIKTLNEEQVMSVIKAFGSHHKGSDEFWTMINEIMVSHSTKLF